MATKTLKSTARKVKAAPAVRKGNAGPAGLAKLFPMNEAARKSAAKAKAKA